MKTISFNSKLLTGFLFGFGLLFVTTVSAQTPATNASQTEEARITSALKDLGTIYGQPVETVAEAQKICDTEKFLSDCAEIGKKYDLYTAEEEKKVDVILENIKTVGINDLKQCTTDECLIAVAKRLASEIGKKNPTLAGQLDLTAKKVAEIEKITLSSKEAGVGFKACREMDPDQATIELLRSCAKLAKHKDVEKYISKDDNDNDAVKNFDKMIDFRQALSTGSLQCGDNTVEGCGNFCLNPSADKRDGSTNAIPQVCRQIAEKFFGKDGIKQLEGVYTNVSQITDFYNKKAENFSFTTLDGKTLTSLEAIGAYMEEQGRTGNVRAVEKGMDFIDRKSTRLNSSHSDRSRMPSSA